MRPAEGVVAIAVLGQMVKPFLCLFKAGDMAGGDRPHDEMRRSVLVEPLALAVVELLMHSVPDENLQGLDALPHREIDRHIRIGKGAEGSGVIALVLQPPDKARCALGNGVDAVEIGHEIGEARIVGRVAETAYVELGEVRNCRVHSSPLFSRILRLILGVENFINQSD